MAEKTLQITPKGQYNNINLKELEDGDFIVVKKKFAEGYKFESKTLKKKDGSPVISYSCRATYGDKEVSFWLNEAQHKLYAACGGIDDAVKIIAKEEKKVNPKTKAKMLINVLSFEKVQ